MGAAAHPGSRLQVRVRLPWRLARARRTRVTSLAVDAHGLWRAGTSDGGHYRLHPDQIWQGPWGWLTIAGPVWALVPEARAPQRLSVTVWAHQVSPARWRRLKVAAQWWIQRAQAMPVGTGEAP